MCSAANSTTMPKKLKIAPTTLPKMAGNDSTIFPLNLLSSSLAYLAIYSKPLHFFDGEPAPPSKTSVIASTIVEFERVIELSSKGQ